MDLPSGVVTFLFTDVEGSTRLFRSLDDRYVAYLDRHNELLRAAWATFDGHEVKTEGDAFFVAFADAGQAIRAAVAAQRAMLSEPWPPDHPFKVRIGIHTGLAQPRDGDYIAFSVHEAARIAGLGHGGQTVVSPATAQLTKNLDDVSLRDLGRWRVRDFDEPINVFQVAGDGLDIEFPPLRTRPAEQHNLRLPSDEFVGRRRELTALADLVQSSPLVTLVGPGGVGKTRTAIEFGAERADQWRDGVWLVDLSHATDLDSVHREIKDSLGLKNTSSELISELAERACLLILDNCEHVADEVVATVDDVLAACPHLVVLATSREPLNSVNERVWRLEPLDPAEEGVTLFVDRAMRINPNLTIDRSVAEQICRQVAGIPIAIELAAARAGTMAIGEILSGLDDALGLLRSRRRDLDDRQRTLSALVGWSYELLEPEEQAAFRRLSLFEGSFTLKAASAAVADPGIESGDVPELVWVLVDKSLVVADLSDAETRYRILNPIRSYGRAKLDDEDEAAGHGRQLARWLVRSSEPDNFLDPGQVGGYALDRMTMASLLAVIVDDDLPLAQHLAWTLARWSSAAAREAEGAKLLAPSLPSISKPGPFAVDLLAEIAFLHQQAGALTDARDVIAQADRLAGTGANARWGGARLEVARAYVEIRAGDLAAAIATAEQALDSSSPQHQVSLLNVMAHAASEAGDDDRLRELCLEGMAAAKQADWPQAEAVMLGGVVEGSLRMGDSDTAMDGLRSAVALDRQLGTMANLALDVLAGARLAQLLDHAEVTVRLQAAGERLTAELGTELFPRDQEINEQTWRWAADHLPGDRVDELRTETQGWDLPTAIDYLEGAVLGDGFAAVTDGGPNQLGPPSR